MMRQRGAGPESKGLDTEMSMPPMMGFGFGMDRNRPENNLLRQSTFANSYGDVGLFS